MKAVTDQTHDGAHEYGLLDSSTSTAIPLTDSSSGDHGETTIMAKLPSDLISEACATATETESKVTALKGGKRQSIPQSFPSEHSLPTTPPAEQPAPPHNDSLASDAKVTKQAVVMEEDLQATLLALKRAEARVALLQANFDKVEALEKDLGIYEMLGEDGDREYRERVETIKRQRSVAIADKRASFEMEI